MSKQISIFPVLVLLVLALLVTGCGGGDDEATGSGNGDSASAGPPTKAEFTKQAEEICDNSKDTRFREAEKYRRVHAKELNSMEPIPREEKIIRAVVLPSVQEETKELAALEPPKGDEKKIEAIIIQLEVGLKKAQKNPYGISLEVPSEYPFRKAGLLIRAYGLVDCRNPA